MKKLRVGFVDIDDATDWSNWSGTPSNMLRALQGHREVHVELITPLKKNLKWLYLPLKVDGTLRKKVYEWRREKHAQRYFAAQIESAFRRFKLDVIFSTSSMPVAKLDSSVPFVFWTDAVFHLLDGYYTGNYSKRALRVGRIQEETALRRANFACYSSAWAASAAMEFAEPDRVKVLPFGPNMTIEHGHSDVEQWIAEREASQRNGCNLLFVGVDWLRKGGPIAVETARLLNEMGISTRLTAVGRPPQQPLPEFVEHIGFLDKSRDGDRRRLVDLYRRSDIFILPSRAESFGIVGCEAAAFGMPALVSHTGGLAEIPVDGISGFRIRTEDGARLYADGAKKILQTYGQFARNAYREYETRLNWDRSTELLVSLLKRAAMSQAPIGAATTVPSM